MPVTNPFVDIERSFLAAFRSNITNGADGGDPIATYDPNDPAPDQPTDDRFAVLSLVASRDQVSTPDSGGTPRSRSIGIAYIEVFEVLGQGNAFGQGMCSRVQAVFERKTIGDVRYRTVRRDNGSGDRQGGHWRTVIAVPLYADDFS